MNFIQIVIMLIWVTLLILGVMIIYVLQSLYEELKKLNQKKRNDTKIF